MRCAVRRASISIRIVHIMHGVEPKSNMGYRTTLCHKIHIKLVLDTHTTVRTVEDVRSGTEVPRGGR